MYCKCAEALKVHWGQMQCDQLLFLLRPQTGSDDLGRSRIWLTALDCVLFRDWKGYRADGGLSIPLKDQVAFNSGSAKAADSTAPLNVSRTALLGSITWISLVFAPMLTLPVLLTPLDPSSSASGAPWPSGWGGPGSATSQVFKRQFVGKMGRNFHFDKALNYVVH